jgi:hypothetical protein
MTGSLAFDGAVGNVIGSLIRNRSLSRSGGNILRSGDPAEAQMMTDWLCRQGEHGKIELEDTQTAVEMLRGMMVMDTQRALMLGQRDLLFIPSVYWPTYHFQVPGLGRVLINPKGVMYLAMSALRSKADISRFMSTRPSLHRRKIR